MLPKTKQQIANELGISMSTLKRKLKTYKLDVPRGLVCPDVQKDIYEQLGYKILWKQKNSNEPKRSILH
jgi:hypothetical protein